MSSTKESEEAFLYNKNNMPISKEIKEAIKESMLSSTSHGIAKIIKSKYLLIKLIWIVFFFVSASICFLLVYQSIAEYLNFEVVTKIRFISEDVAPFPAISICNKNPFLTKYSIDFLTDLYKNITNSTYEIESTKYRLDSKLDFVNFILKNDTFYLLALRYIKSKMFPDENKKALGFSRDQMFIKCNFATQDCDLETDLSWYFHPFFGNCFIFNPHTNSPDDDQYAKTVSGVGVDYSLNLEIFAGLQDTYPTKESNSGITISVFNRSSLPTTGRQMDINIGIETNLGIKRSFINKLKKPYSDCDLDLNSANVNSYDSEYYRKIFKSNYSYSKGLCIALCYQEILFQKCKCYDLFAHNIMNDETCNTAKDFDCLDKVQYSAYGRLGSLCKSYCPNECNFISFSFTTWFSKYPSKEFAVYLKNTHPLLKELDDSEQTYEKIKQSVLRLVIHYETLDYQLVTELPNTNLITLLSNIGGTLGLCLGISILSFIEIFEILTHVIMIILRRDILSSNNRKT